MTSFNPNEFQSNENFVWQSNKSQWKEKERFFFVDVDYKSTGR